MHITIRRAQADDAAALHSVAASTFPLACPPGTEQRGIAEFVAAHLSRGRMTEYLADPARVLFVADDGARIVGYTMLVLGEPSDDDAAAAITVRPSAELSKCYLLADYHGAGVASTLVDATVNEARAHGVAGVWLGVNQANARANRFYEKCGFRLVGTKRFRIGQGFEDDFVRELVL